MRPNNGKRISAKEFIECISIGDIPEFPPVGSSVGGNIYDFHIDHFSAREECTSRGMWAIVDKVWTKELAGWIGERSCLEVMAGAGWLAKALTEHGAKVIATDSASWSKKHHKMLHVFEIKKLDGFHAVKKYDADILIVSWPPYGEFDICRICETWGRERPVVYIGEGKGGCNAPDEFWNHFKQIENQPNIPLMAWRGIHDYVFIGNYAK